jgi:TetR/AcrR family transcriptional regulator, acrAB operon repressor
MARRTKEDAQATRSSLLDAAEHLFQAKGVSRTSLNDIAVAAGTTRGAIYWHFKDKADLFNAMMERVTLPMESALQRAGAVDGSDALAQMRAAILHALHRTAHDAQTRRVFEVATQKVEYADDLSAVRGRHIAVRNDCIAQMEHGLVSAAEARGVALAIPPAEAARGLHALVDGLIQNWLLDPLSFELEPTGRFSIDAYLAGLGLPVRDAPCAKIAEDNT